MLPKVMKDRNLREFRICFFARLDYKSKERRTPTRIQYLSYSPKSNSIHRGKIAISAEKGARGAL
jgi:hypothetical protein